MTNTAKPESTMHRPVLLAVDDEPDNLEFVTRAFRRDFEVHIAHDGVEALRVAADAIPDVIVTDQRMPNMTGMEFLAQLDRICPESIRIVLTGYADVEVAVDAINTGHVVRFLTKPATPEQLRKAVSEALEDRAFDDEARQWTAELLQQQDSLASRADALSRTLQRWRWDPLTRTGALRALIEQLKRGRAALSLIAVDAPWVTRPNASKRRSELVAVAEHLRRLTAAGGARVYHYDGTYFLISVAPSAAAGIVEALRNAEAPRLVVGAPVDTAQQSPVPSIEAALAALDSES